MARQQEITQEGVQEEVDVEDIDEGRAEGGARPLEGDEGDKPWVQVFWG